MQPILGRRRAATLLAAGCALPSRAFAQAGDAPISIGVLGDQSGMYKDNSGPGAVAAAEMAVEDFGGSVLGRKVVVRSADHQMKADVGSAIARQWFDAEGVDLVTDLTNSAVALAVQQLARERGKVAIFTSPGSTDLTGKACSPTGFHWVYDNYSNGHGLATAAVEAGLKTWFFVTVDFAFGRSLEENLGRAVREAGGTVAGSTYHPLNTTDFSSYLLQAQASRAQVIAVASAGADLVNTIKQAAEFGLAQNGQRLVTPVMFLADVRGLGLQAAKGLTFVNGFYWDANEETRAWSQRFFQRRGVMPEMTQAGTYSGVLHYLKAVRAAGTKDGPAVAESMRQTQVDDFFARGGVVRQDGRMVHDMLLVEVKPPAESRGPWDLLRTVSVIPGEQAFLPLAQSECGLVRR